MAALRAGCAGAVSTHSLLAEGDVDMPGGVLHVRQFQPTPSSRRETGLFRFALQRGEFQPTPSSRRETRRPRHHPAIGVMFQPTPSSRRETRFFCPKRLQIEPFQPTPSSRRETATGRAHLRLSLIHI